LAIELVVIWLKYLPNVFKKSMAELRVDYDLFLVDEDIAIVQSVNEVMGMLQRIFLGCHRAIRFYKHFDLNQEQRSPDSVTKDYTNIDFVKRRIPIDDEYDIDEVKNQIYQKHNQLIFG
jgi:hypothetical protein